MSRRVVVVVCEKQGAGPTTAAVPAVAWLRPTPGGPWRAEAVLRVPETTSPAASHDGGIGDDAADCANPVFQPVARPLDGTAVDGHGERIE